MTATEQLTPEDLMTTAEGTHHAVLASPIGPLTAVRDDEGLVGLYFPGHWTRPDAARWGVRADVSDGFDDLASQLGEYFAGNRREFDVPLHVVGTERAMQLWALLARIPFGSTTTYGALAAAMGDGISARAIGGFVGHNPISVLVPCHRVVGAAGNLTGYAGGLERKRYLLELEGALAPTLL